MISAEGRPTIGRQRADGQSITFYKKRTSADRLLHDIGRFSTDDRPTVSRSYTLVNGIFLHCKYKFFNEIKSCIYRFIGPCVQISSGLRVRFLLELFVRRF